MYGNNFVFRGGEGSEALSTLNLITKQFYKLRELNLLSKGKALNKETLRKQDFCIFWSQKTVLLHFLLPSYPLRTISFVSLHNCTTDNKPQVFFSGVKSCKCTQSQSNYTVTKKYTIEIVKQTKT